MKLKILFLILLLIPVVFANQIYENEDYAFSFVSDFSGEHSLNNIYVNGTDCELEITVSVNNEIVLFKEYQREFNKSILLNVSKGDRIRVIFNEVSNKTFIFLRGTYMEVPRETSCYFSEPYLEYGNVSFFERLTYTRSFPVRVLRSFFGSRENFYNSFAFYLLWIVIVFIGFLAFFGRKFSEMLFLYALAVISFGMLKFGPYSLGLYGLGFLSIFAIIAGSVLFYKNRERIEKEVEEEEVNEEKAEQRRAKEFSKKFKKINKIPILRGIVKWMYKEGFAYVLILLLILTLFTIVKAPYFGISFTGEHTMKYNTHVEPAKYMYERNDPFWMQRKYQSDPVNNPQGIFSTFGSPPLHEWGLLTTFYLFPNNTLEFNTRLWTHFLGIIMLILGYCFLKKWCSKNITLIIIFLLSINPILNFIYFVTVEDSFLLIFMFASLIFLTNYIKSNNIKDLYWAGIMFGIGNVNKYSLFLWLAPIAFIIIVSYNKKIQDIIKTFGIYTILSLIPIITFRTSLRNLPNNLVMSLVLFLLWIIGYILLYYILKLFERNIDKTISIILRNKILLIIIIILSISGSIVFFQITQLYRFSNEFLTDLTLIFNWDMYWHMLNQFKFYMTPSVYYIGLIGFLILAINKFKKYRILLGSLLVGSLVYWILASKSMFFHNYYTGIIMITFVVGAGFISYLFAKTNPDKRFFIIVIILIMFIIVPISLSYNTQRISKEADVESLKQVAQFLIENTEEHEIFIDDSYILSVIFYVNRPRIEEFRLIQDEIITSIQEIGFGSTMKSYNISFLITTRNTPRFDRYVNLFTIEDLQSVAYRRGENIISRLDIASQYFSDIKIRNKIIESENIASKFVLEKEFGRYKIYSFAD